LRRRIPTEKSDLLKSHKGQVFYQGAKGLEPHSDQTVCFFCRWVGAPKGERSDDKAVSKKLNNSRGRNQEISREGGESELAKKARRETFGQGECACPVIRGPKNPPREGAVKFEGEPLIGSEQQP